MPGSGPGSRLGSWLFLPDASFLEDGQYVVAEIGKLVGVMKERQSGSAESRFMQLDDALGHLLGRADQGKSAVAGGKAFADQGQQVVREGLGVGELQAYQVVDG